MAGFTRTVVINKPVDLVFDFATNLDNASRLLPGVTKTEMLTEGGLRPGAKFRETRLMNGKERTAVIEIVEHERPSAHAACAGMLGMRATYRFRFTPEGAGTRVDMEAEVRGNLLWKIFLRAISKVMEKEDGDYLTHLKRAMEPI